MSVRTLLVSTAMSTSNIVQQLIGRFSLARVLGTRLSV